MTVHLIAVPLVLLSLLVALTTAFRSPVRFLRRWLVLLALRLATLAALGCAAIGPTRQVQQQVQLAPAVAVVVDTSQSMGLSSGVAQSSRLQTGLAAAEAVAGRLAHGPQAPHLQWTSTRGHLQPTSPDHLGSPSESTTDLRAVLRALCNEAHLGAALVVSDGADTEGARGSELVSLAQGAGLPVNVLAVGQDKPPRDVAVESLTAPQRVRANAQFELRAALRATGTGQEALRLQITRDGKNVASLSTKPRVGSVTVPLRAGAPGRYRYSIRAAAIEGELTEANNQRSALVEVVPDKPNVLLISGQPSVEYAFLKRFLLADQSIRASIWVRKSPGGFWRDDDRLQRAADPQASDLRQVNAVLLQNLPTAALSGISSPMAEAVRRGAGLAVLGGPHAATIGPLSALLPAQLVGYADEAVRAQMAPSQDPLSEALRSAGMGLAGLPLIRGRNSLTGLRRDSRTVLTAAGRPLLVAWQVERGRALVLGTDGLHRWVFGPEGGQAGQAAYRSLWATLVDWLTEIRDDRPVIAQFDRETYQVGTPARLVVQVTDSAFQPVVGATVVASLHLGAEAAQQVTCTPIPDQPGRYQAAVPTDAPGLLRAEASAALAGRKWGASETEAAVVPAVMELAESRPNPRLLQALAEASGGARLTPTERPTAPLSLRPTPHRVSRMATVSLARGPMASCVLLLLCTLDWALRRRWQG